MSQSLPSDQPPRKALTRQQPSEIEGSGRREYIPAPLLCETYRRESGIRYINAASKRAGRPDKLEPPVPSVSAFQIALEASQGRRTSPLMHTRKFIFK
jgi:hypothetical protein